MISVLEKQHHYTALYDYPSNVLSVKKLSYILVYYSYKILLITNYFPYFTGKYIYLTTF